MFDLTLTIEEYIKCLLAYQLTDEICLIFIIEVDSTMVTIKVYG
uniref:Uncharacterized protein n=1 Tax=Cucumis melo TaxID=3656 RepID=A0A9I9CCF3_CUCME